MRGSRAWGGGTPSSWLAVLASGPFRRLLTVRLVGQVADGLLQIGLAGFVFFSPERAAEPAMVAAGLAVLLLPYSFVGPFAGVLIDRWSRRQVLLVANIARAAGLLTLALLVSNGVGGPAFYLLALGILGLNRFVLAALGASLPHVVPTPLLVTANAVAPSAGTVAAVVGAALGAVVRAWAGGGDRGSTAAVAAAAGTCLLAGLLALRLGRGELGPGQPLRLSARRAVADVVSGVVGGLRHLGQRVPAARALLLMTGYRFCYGAGTVWALLLIRNSFHPDDTDTGFALLGVTVAATGFGVLVGAVATPAGTSLLGTHRWSAAVLVVAGTAQLASGLLSQPWALVVGASAIAAAVQAVKIGVDSVVQATVDDEYRGRVFTVYDLLFNASFVAAAALAATVLPASGKSPVAVGAMAAGYLGLAYWYRREPRPASRQP